MKDHGSENATEVPVRALKSLLKKPGQSKAKGHKNRVVINEKLNEFFAADYIILIKEECCTDYEEECDCCCQEHEMIRLGNCKECRAELNLHFGGDGRFGDGCEDDVQVQREQVFGSEESLGEEEEEEDDDEEENEEDDEDEPEVIREVTLDEKRNVAPQRSQHQQRETLSPPEGYKDLCVENEMGKESEHRLESVCAECNYYQRATEAEECVEGQVEDLKNAQESTRHLEDGSLQPTIDQAQQTTPDLHQRYLVETITMTTVTERRIVREISEEETQPLDEIDSTNEKDSLNGSKLEFSICPPPDAKDIISGHSSNEDVNKSPESMTKIDKRASKEISEASDLSLTFKLGTSLATNSLKPNSAVRQLFPDPRFISPPPAPTKNISLSDVDDEDEHSEAQKFLITTESLRLFDAVKRTKIAGNRSDSSESESSSIKRTIERNALRRSLISKYDSGSKKKNLRSKDLTLEERIRQLTCVDQDEDTGDSNSSENGRTVEGCDQNNELPARTSPSGEERPKNDRVPRTINQEQETNLTPPLQVLQNHHHHQQSTYKKITDLFGQKKNVEMNLPDIGLGNRMTIGKEYISKSSISKMNTEARKQFLSSLAPLSCVASTGEGKEDYYRISSKLTGSNRDMMGYNSDSSYSLEDIEAALRGEERNYRNAGPPDVTRGTPTSIGPDSGDASDELMAFVEQDKSRTERIKRRYNDVDDRHEGTSVDGDIKENGKDKKGCVDDDEDDELNDYGFNRRPAVRGIKPQFGTTEEIVQQLRTRSAAATSLPDRTSLPPHWTFYDNTNDNGEKQESFADDANSETYKTTFNSENPGNHTINRINSMQRQIDDIYQTIADSSVNAQGLDRSYIEGTLPRTLVHVAVGDASHRYVDQKNGVHFQDQISGHRMVRVAGADVVPTSGYNSLPSKSRRHPLGFANYSCSAVPTSNPKCYRTMYLVPYNGITDPAYQNLQRILPAHSTPTNYANHIDRYPYPRNRVDQQPRYYVRPNNPATSNPHSQPQLHLHLHQSDEVHVASPPVGLNHTVQSIHLQHHQHHQVASYSGQSVPSYTVIAPPRATSPYTHQVHLSRSASDVQTQTVSLPPTVSTSNSIGSTLTTFTGSTQILGTMTSSTILASPTKLQHQRNNPCTVAERGVPEGAASAPAQDFNQTSSSNSSHTVTNSFIGHPNNVPPPNTQNSVYYAMNV